MTNKHIELPALTSGELVSLDYWDTHAKMTPTTGTVSLSSKQYLAIRAAQQRVLAEQAEPVAWCELTQAGTISYFDGKPMIMCGPVCNEHHPHALYLASPPAPQEAQADEQAVFEEWLARVCPSGDVESVQYQWVTSSDYANWCDAAPVAQPATEQAEEPRACVEKLWAIDTSAGRPILVLNGCSVIEAEEAAYILSLVRRDQPSQPTASNAGEREAILRDLIAHAVEVGDHTEKSFNNGVLRLADRARAALASKPAEPVAPSPLLTVDEYQAKYAHVHLMNEDERYGYESLYNEITSGLQDTTPAPAGQIVEDEYVRWLKTAMFRAGIYGPHRAPLINHFCDAIRAARGDEGNQK